jgi:hypothetical protein
MASKRNIRRRACDGKTRYPTPESAVAEAAVWSQWNARHELGHGAIPLNSYYCIFCHGWHIGHAVRSERRTRRKQFD